VLGRLVDRWGVGRATILISLGCIVASVLITLVLVLFTGHPHYAFELKIAFVCSLLVAPPVVLSYARMYVRLTQSHEALTAELSLRLRAEQSTRHVEDRLLEFIENADEAFFMSTPDMTSFEYVSRAYETIWGRSRESLVNAPARWLRTIHREDRRRVTRIVRQTAQDPSEFEYRILRPDHSIRWIRSRLICLRDANGKHVRTVGFSEDMTDRRKAEMELRSQRAAGIRSDRLRSLGEMSAGMAHELNQPLVGVRGIVEHILIGLGRGWDMQGPELEARLSKVLEQADRMVHIIDHVRLFAREAGQPETRCIEINDVCESAVSLLRAQFASKSIRIHSDLSGNLPAVVANPYSLEEVIINLLNNARDSTEERGDLHGEWPAIELTTGVEHDGAGTLVRVEVCDHGVGISKEGAGRIFDAFYTTKDPERGTGLGLSVSKTIVEEIGGQLELHSAGPNTGARAVIRLPAAASDEAMVP